MILILSLAFFLLIPTSLTSQAKLIVFWMQKDSKLNLQSCPCIPSIGIMKI